MFPGFLTVFPVAILSLPASCFIECVRHRTQATLIIAEICYCKCCFENRSQNLTAWPNRKSWQFIWSIGINRQFSEGKSVPEQWTRIIALTLKKWRLKTWCSYSTEDKSSAFVLGSIVFFAVTFRSLSTKNWLIGWSRTKKNWKITFVRRWPK